MKPQCSFRTQSKAKRYCGESSVDTNRAVAINKTFEMKQPVRIEREIVSYDIETKEPVEYCNIDLIPFKEIISIVVPKADDPALYDGHPLTNEHVNAFNKALSGIINIDFKKHYYVLECTGIYE